MLKRIKVLMLELLYLELEFATVGFHWDSRLLLMTIWDEVNWCATRDVPPADQLYDKWHELNCENDAAKGFNQSAVAKLRYTGSLMPRTYLKCKSKSHLLSCALESRLQMSYDSLWQIEHCISANRIQQEDSICDIQVLMSEYETRLTNLWQSGSVCPHMIEVQVHRNLNLRPANSPAMPRVSWHRYWVLLRLSVCQMGYANMQWSIGNNHMSRALSGTPENPVLIILTDPALRSCQSHLSIKTD